jgi:CheY-like chemotaxis protein
MPHKVFEKTVNILVVDDTPGVLEVAEALFDTFGVYKVTTAGSTKEAIEKINRSKKRFHACAFDLGLDDVEENEYYLLDHYGMVMPFVIISARQEVERLFECGKRGAMGFAKKTNVEFSEKLLFNVNKFALMNMICPTYNEVNRAVRDNCVEALFSTNPRNVNEWARNAGVHPRQIYRDWKERQGINPLHALCLFHLYSGIFAQIQTCIAGVAAEAPFCLEDIVKSLMESEDCRKAFEHYLENRAIIDAHIWAFHVGK